MQGRRLVMVAISSLVVGLGATAFAIDLGSTVKSTAKGAAEKAGKEVVEKQINDKLAAQNCTFKGKTTETACKFNEIVAILKAGQLTAEKSGLASVTVNVEAHGPDSKTASARADSVRSKLQPIFQSWNYDVRSKEGGNDLAFSVKVR